jgi:hypothetical protein
MSAVRNYYAGRYDEAVAAFTKELDQLSLFWRPVPSLSFPWNKAE